MTFIVLFLLTLASLSIFIFIPYWTRRTESFGVSIPESLYERKDLAKMRKQYAISMSLIGLILLIIFLSIYIFMEVSETGLAILVTTLVIIYLFASFITYLVFHFKMKKLKAKEDWQNKRIQKTLVYTKFRDEKLTISNWWYIIPFVATLSIALLTLFKYDQLPNEIPINYNLAGEVTNWRTKSYGTVLMMPALQLFLIATFLFINIIIARAKQQVSSENPEKSIQQNVIFRRRWSIFLFISSIVMIAMFILFQIDSYFLKMNKVVMLILPMMVSFGMLIGALILSVTTGQGGSRVKLPENKDESVIDYDDDDYWKLGQFYFNKEDPAVFIEKRFGIGWTMNFARPLGWIFLISVIAIPLIIAIAL